MKKGVAAILLGGLFAGVLSCQKDDPIVPLQADNFDGKVVIVPLSGKFSVKMNQRVDWKTTAGTAVQTDKDSLVYTAPSTLGIQRMVVKSQRNPQDSLMVTVAVTPRANDFRLLQKGGYVLMFRHAAADVGSDQTGSVVKEWWKSCDSQLARQLNAQGKLDAVNTGKTLRALQIPVKRVLSSEYCRCFTSADLMALGVPTQQLKEITYFVYDEANRYTNSLTLAASQPMDGSNTVVVGHAGFSGTLPSPAILNSLNWGDAAIYQIVSGQPAKYISTLGVKEWTDLAK